MTTPWGQLPNEPDSSFVRFMAYLALGPGRSIRRAYRAWARQRGGNNPQQKAAGSWTKDSARFDWPARARAFDLATFNDVGKDAVIALVNAINETSVRTLRALKKSKGPRDWPEILETLKLLSLAIPAETIVGLMSQQKKGTK